jgi:hypothetical protein
MKAREFISTKLTIFLSVAALAVFAAACGTSQIASSGDKNVSEVLAGKQTETNDTNRDFRAEFKAEPANIEAGKEATLVFTVKDKQGGVVKDLPLVHEKPMHLLVVSRDLAEFYHIHPEPQSDGSYRVAHVFPNGGEYRLYADFTPKDAKQVVEPIDIKVAGTERAKVALVPDQKFEKSVKGLKVVMKPQGEIKAGNELMLEFAAFDEKTNKPATDLQNYLGELAHFVIISEDMQDFVHAHPMSKGEHDAMKKPEMKTGEHKADGHKHGDEKTETKTASQSEVAAHTAFPRSGLYKVWAQFQRNNEVITVPFVVNVKPGEQKAGMKEANVPAGAIKVTVSKNGYEPAEIKLEKGKPAKIAFYRSDAENCGGEVVFSKLNITKKLPVGETVLVEFTPQDSGEISFACGMNMMKGKVLVQ